VQSREKLGARVPTIALRIAIVPLDDSDKGFYRADF
jgi:hypothetical protein